jgi:hypothetical protein
MNTSQNLLCHLSAGHPHSTPKIAAFHTLDSRIPPSRQSAFQIVHIPVRPYSRQPLFKIGRATSRRVKGSLGPSSDKLSSLMTGADKLLRSTMSYYVAYRGVCRTAFASLSIQSSLSMLSYRYHLYPTIYNFHNNLAIVRLDAHNEGKVLGCRL